MNNHSDKIWKGGVSNVTENDINLDVIRHQGKNLIVQKKCIFHCVIKGHYVVYVIFSYVTDYTLPYFVAVVMGMY